MDFRVEFYACTKEFWMAGAQIQDLCMAILQSLCMRLTTYNRYPGFMDFNASAIH
ncbi:hypothetical protein GGTG_07140 [Gaeumannomyces tritici R3-111a-1]|uniref:Uncharacterized protein n=1 Tax=Gaeumannomyces tritici (strain R3-111a-1) TaxID=644352 RepID=J3P0U4_GAET3|nr:hypothetical protein GGTG_07140 [Gaeumannomyces tritici R3-111a-1]EJT77228.1 hypothetical protein GGTG_07140 [Gaeumannomyces tritici R3-111a-1]